MSDAPSTLSCTAKLARVVLANRGPLSAGEIAEEGRIDEADAREALAELEERGVAECVCGVCATREEVYSLTDGGLATQDS